MFDYEPRAFEFRESEPLAARQRQHRLSSSEMVAVAQAYRTGSSMKQLARDFQVHRTTITGCLVKLGIPIRVLGMNSDDVPTAVALYEAGWSLVRLGDHFGCDAETVRKGLRAEGVAMRKPWERK